MVVKTRRRRAVSELYASVLMIGVTLAFGSFVAAAALNQFNLSTYAGSLAAGAQEASAGKQVSLVYGTVPTPGSGGCTTAYKGVTEGTGYTLVLYDYGSVSFTPTKLFVNGSLYSGSLGMTVPVGGMGIFTLTLPSCVHPSGQTFLFVDLNGDEVQVGT